MKVSVSNVSMWKLSRSPRCFTTFLETFLGNIAPVTSFNFFKKLKRFGAGNFREMFKAGWRGYRLVSGAFQPSTYLLGTRHG
jgi:hypothetical protein